VPRPDEEAFGHGGILTVMRGGQRAIQDLCWCGSGVVHAHCHGPFDRPGPGAALNLAAHAFSWAVRPVPTSGPRPAPPGVPAPDYAVTGVPGPRYVADRRTPDEIAALRLACRHAAELLVHLARLVAPGVTTDQLDAAAHRECARRGVYPSTLNYHGYPKSICTSVNEVICHGIPDSRPLASGDTLNIDVTVYCEGAHGDCSATVLVGQVNPVARRLVRAALRCLNAGIAAVRPHAPFSEVGRAIQTVADQLDYAVVRQFVGHGIGPLFHTGLQVLHHFSPDQRQPMEPGMVFTVEPMINAGSHRALILDDGWTAITADRSRSAQFEHTVLVTERGVEVLTPNRLAPAG
jgi:methionyl aminopeptidase